MRVLWRTFILALPAASQKRKRSNASHVFSETGRKMAKNSKLKQNSKFKSGAKQKQRKCVLMFDDKDRQ